MKKFLIGVGCTASFLVVTSLFVLDLKVNGQVPFPGGGGMSGGGSGSSAWLSVTNPTSVSFAWRNQGTATLVTGTNSILLNAVAAAGDSIKGREIVEPATPVSITIGIIPFIQNVASNNAGLYVTDGTKLVCLSVGATSVSATNTLVVNNFTNVTTFSAAATSTGIGFHISPVYLKVLDDGTNLVWSWSPDGTNFTQIQTGLRTAFLAAPTAIGFFTDSANATYPAKVLLISWTQGTT